MKKYFLLEIVAICVETLWGFVVYARILEKRILWRQYIFATILPTAVIYCLNQISLISAFTAVVGVLLLALMVYIIYQTNYKECVAIMSAYIMLITILDLVVTSLMGYLLRRPDLASAITEESGIRAILLIISKVLLIPASYLLVLLYRQLRRTPWDATVILIVGVIAMYHLSARTFAQTDADTLALWLYALVTMGSVSYATIQYRDRKILEKQKKLKDELAEMAQENYQLYVKNQKEKEVFYHDLRNQLLMIKTYVENEEYEKAKTYLEKMQIPGYIEEKRVVTGVEALDILITYKCMVAEREKILFNIKADKIKTGMLELEVVALFGNLLDNAIEACQYIDDECRVIELVIQGAQEMTFISISNPYIRIQEIDGFYIPEKKDKMFHGIGLVSVKSIVDKYDGTLEFKHDDGIFTVEVSFFAAKQKNEHEKLKHGKNRGH